MNDFGPRLRTRRKELKLTLRALAEKAGCTASFLCDVERGKRRIGADLLLAICRELGLPMQETMTGSTEPNRPTAAVPVLPAKLLAWAAQPAADIPFRHVLTLYWLWRTLENYRTNAAQRSAEEFDWCKFYRAVGEFL